MTPSDSDSDKAMEILRDQGFAPAGWSMLQDAIATALAAAREEGRREEREPMGCGHPRACWSEIEPWPSGLTHAGGVNSGECSACTREERAVEEAVAQWRNLTEIAVNALERGTHGEREGE